MRGTLVIVGTGIQWAGQTTLSALRAIEVADRVLFAVADPGTARWILELRPDAESFAYPRTAPRRREIYDEMVERMLAEVRGGKKVCAVFYGHPGVFARAPHEVIRRARSEGISARMLPGVSAADCLFTDLGLDPGDNGCQMYDATDFLLRRRAVDVHTPLVLWQIALTGNLGVFDAEDRERITHGLRVLGEVLCARYAPTHEVMIYEAASSPIDAPRMERIALCRVSTAHVSEVSTLYVPPLGPAARDDEMAIRLRMDA